MVMLEMDAASNRGIDDIRQLRERIGLAPAQGEMTVYVIDEVHMLTTEAFNALLKTLEEPPRHAVFVLCTTEAHKVPDTVKSRCMSVQFVKASRDEVIRSLAKAVEGEGIEIDDKALEAIATRVDGSFRDGMKVLEQLAMQGTKVTLENVDVATAFAGEYEVTPLINCVFHQDVQGALDILQQKEELGVDFGLLAKRLVEELRRKLLATVQVRDTDLEAARDLVQLTEKAMKAATAIKFSPVAVLPLELLVVEWGISSKVKGQKSQISSNTRALDEKRMLKESSTIPASGDDARSFEKSNIKIDVRADNNPSKIVEDFKTPQNGSLLQEEQSALELIAVRQAWPRIMQAVKPHNLSLEALLRAAEPDTCDSSTLKLRVFYAFHKEQLEQQRHVKILEEVFAKELGTQVRLEFVLGSKTRGLVGDTTTTVVNVTGNVEDEDLAQDAEEIFGK
jgi:DNA polymerase-3 subunit gamma/tau